MHDNAIIMVKILGNRTSAFINDIQRCYVWLVDNNLSRDVFTIVWWRRQLHSMKQMLCTHSSVRRWTKWTKKSLTTTIFVQSQFGHVLLLGRSIWRHWLRQVRANLNTSHVACTPATSESYLAGRCKPSLKNSSPKQESSFKLLPQALGQSLVYSY